MDSLQVRTGQISLRILDDNENERGIFKFNPYDIECSRRFVTLQDELKIKQVEFENNYKSCVTIDSKMDLLNSTVDYFKDLTDRCFGIGTSELLFGSAKTLSMFFDFFEGIAPYYEKASSDRLSKYKDKFKEPVA